VGLCDVHHWGITGVVLDAVDDGGLVGGGEVGASAFGSEGFADILVELGQVDVLGVDFVYDDEARHIGLGGEFEELSGVCFYAGGGGDNETSGFGGRDSFYGGADEVGVAGSVDDVDGAAGVGGVGDGGDDGVLALPFLVVVVANGGAIVDASREVLPAPPCPRRTMLRISVVLATFESPKD
jgi:hypothetical protein